MKPKAAVLPPEEVRLGLDIALHAVKHVHCMSGSAAVVLSAQLNCQQYCTANAAHNA